MLNIRVSFTGFEPEGFDAGGLTYIELPEQAKISDLAAELRLPQEMLLIYIVCGELANMDSKLKDGDVVQIFSPLIGG